MILTKALVIGILAAGLVGSAGLFVIASVEPVIDEARNVLPDWGGGGGCHGGYGRGYYDRDYSSDHPCHDDDEDQEYCPYHEESFTSEEWEEHRDECPYLDGSSL